LETLILKNFGWENRATYGQDEWSLALTILYIYGIFDNTTMNLISGFIDKIKELNEI